MENSSNKLVPVLVILLIVASFLIGSLYTKVNMLEKGAVAGTVNTGGTANNNNAPTQPNVEPTPAPVDIDVTGAPVLGSKSAKIAIVEFTDFQCPFCKQYFDNVFQSIKKDYIDTSKVQFISMDYPLTQIHPKAQKAAEAAECANRQGKFWEYHDTLFKNQSALEIADLKKYAVDLGLSVGTFNTCLDNGDAAEAIKKDQALGDRYGVRGTPASYIGYIEGNTIKQAKQISGAVPFENFKTEIEALLK